MKFAGAATVRSHRLSETGISFLTVLAARGPGPKGSVGLVPSEVRREGSVPGPSLWFVEDCLLPESSHVLFCVCLSRFPFIATPFVLD